MKIHDPCPPKDSYKSKVRPTIPLILALIPRLYDGSVVLACVDKNGKTIPGGTILKINKNGKLFRYNCITPEIEELTLDRLRRIELTTTN